MQSTSLNKSGYVLKKAQVRGWKPRFVVADPRYLRLVYYKESPASPSVKERGDLPLTGCTVSLDATCEDDEYRFLVTTRDRKNAFHLETEDDAERSEWIRVIKLISALGLAAESVIKTSRMGATSAGGTGKRRGSSSADLWMPTMDELTVDVIGKATHMLLDSLDAQAKQARQSLDDVAQHKWRAKIELTESKREMTLKLQTLREKMSEMRTKDSNYRKEIMRLSTFKEGLEKEVSHSNTIQQEIVKIFASCRSNTAKELKEKANDAVRLCQRLLAKIPAPVASKLITPSTSDGLKNRARSISDPSSDGLTASSSTPAASSSASDKSRRCVEEEMISLIIRLFDILQPTSDDGLTSTSGGDSSTVAASPSSSSKSIGVATVLQLYAEYYIKVHKRLEDELRSVSSELQQFHASIGFVRNKYELARREDEEILWVLYEMQRAILKLSKEGVIAEEKGIGSGAATSASSLLAAASSPTDESSLYDRGAKKKSSDLIAVVSHRATWSEASETIFQLNVAREQELRATKSLEESLTSREMVRSWFEEKLSA